MLKTSIILPIFSRSQRSEASLDAERSHLRMLPPHCALLIFILAILNGGCVTTDRPITLNAAGNPPPAQHLYITGPPPHSTTLNPLEAETLADASDKAAVDIEQPTMSAGPTEMVVTTDAGRKVAVMSRRAQGDGVTTAQIRLFKAGGDPQETTLEMSRHSNVMSFRFSDEGRYLLLQEDFEWFVLDGTTGQHLTTITLPHTEGCCGNSYWLDVADERMYQLLIPNMYGHEASGSALLLVHDIGSGAEVGRLTLIDVAAGPRLGDKTSPDGPSGYWPGLALSPDGRTIAIHHADREALTLIDAERLTINKTLELTYPTGWLEWLGPAPAHAKMMQGDFWRLHFTPDGQALYAFGSRQGYEPPHNTPTFEGLGLRRIEMADGMISAETLVGAAIEWLRPAPDGSAVYVFGPRDSEPLLDRVNSPYVLRRLEPGTLTVTAEREFEGYRSLYFLSSQ